MTVHLDTDNGTCSTTLENATHTSAIKDVRVSQILRPACPWRISAAIAFT